MELALPIDEAVSPEDASGHIYADESGKSTAIRPTRARFKIFDQEKIASIEPGVEEITFSVKLEQTGVTQLDAWFLDESGEERGAYYVYVERLSRSQT